MIFLNLILILKFMPMFQTTWDSQHIISWMTNDRPSPPENFLVIVSQKSLILGKLSKKKKMFTQQRFPFGAVLVSVALLK